MRVVWLDRPPRNTPTSVLVFTGSRARKPLPTTMILRRSNATAFHTLTPDTANAVASGLLLTLPQPAFAMPTVAG